MREQLKRVIPGFDSALHASSVAMDKLKSPIAAAVGVIAGWKLGEHLTQGDTISTGQGDRVPENSGRVKIAVKPMARIKIQARMKQSNPATGASTGSSNGGTVGSYLDERTQAMQDIENIAVRGREIYDGFQIDLEAHQWGKCVCINVDTGEYVIANTFSEVHALFKETFGDAPSWDTQVGAPPYVIRTAGALQ